MKSVSALFLTSFLYALVHFLDNGQISIPPNPTFYDAIFLVFGYLEPIVARPLQIFPEFFGLFLFGLLLNTAFLKTRSLFPGIGIHAGAVFLIKFQNSFVRKGFEAYYWFIGNTPLYDGIFEWILLVGLWAFIYRFAPLWNKRMVES